MPLVSIGTFTHIHTHPITTNLTCVMACVHHSQTDFTDLRVPWLPIVLPTSHWRPLAFIISRFLPCLSHTAMVLVTAHILSYNLPYHRERFLFQTRAKEGSKKVKSLTRLSSLSQQNQQPRNLGRKTGLILISGFCTSLGGLALSAHCCGAWHYRA